jgi:hypothetical protein
MNIACKVPVPVLRIRDVYPGSKFFHPGSRVKKDSISRIRVHIKELKYFQNKKMFLSSQKYDPRCSFRIRILIFITHLGSRGQKGTGSRIRNTAKYGTVL